MTLGGFANHVARIDLSRGAVTYEGINERDARLYIGARGLGVKYLLDNGPTVDPTSPANMLALVNGPLSGGEATMSGRLAFVTKSPLTGTVIDSHQGGWSAARLRWAGFDALLFTGKANRPVYAFVSNGTVELRPAEELWGKGVHETVRIMRDRYGEEVSVMAIGPAGENRILFAAIINENDRAAGRGGAGAVAGMKNLKAVVGQADKASMPKAADRRMEERAPAGAQDHPGKRSHRAEQRGAVRLRHERADEPRQCYGRPGRAQFPADDVCRGGKGQRRTGPRIDPGGGADLSRLSGGLQERGRDHGRTVQRAADGVL